MSAIQIEGLQDLHIHDRNLCYRGNLIEFDAIRSVQFTATEIRHSMNFIPTGSTFSSELFLILESGEIVQIRQERAFRGKTQRKKMEAVWQAAEVISIATFNRRIHRCERELADKNFFHAGEYHITADGGIFERQRRLFGLLDKGIELSLGPFQLHVERPRHGLRRFFRAEKYVIEIDTDRDCILYMLKHYLGICFKDAHVREKAVDRRQLFFSAVLRLGAKLCKADGRISRDEIRAFKSTFKIDAQTVRDAACIFEEAAVSSEGVEEIAAEVFSLVGDNQELLEYIVVGLMQVAAADGTFHKLEATIVRRICDAFGFPEAKTLALFAMFGVSALGEEAEQTGEARDGQTWGNGLAEIYLRILGVSPDASRDEIKVAYRKLAREHHPDALRAKGVPIDAMRQSEEVLKKINEAYGYLNRRT